MFLLIYPHYVISNCEVSRRKLKQECALVHHHPNRTTDTYTYTHEHKYKDTLHACSNNPPEAHSINHHLAGLLWDTTQSALLQPATAWTLVTCDCVSVCIYFLMIIECIAVSSCFLGEVCFGGLLALAVEVYIVHTTYTSVYCTHSMSCIHETEFESSIFKSIDQTAYKSVHSVHQICSSQVAPIWKFWAVIFIIFYYHI